MEPWSDGAPLIFRVRVAVGPQNDRKARKQLHSQGGPFWIFKSEI